MANYLGYATPPERLVGVGIEYDESELAVSCGYCKAPIGTPCVRKVRRQGAANAPHAPRIDKARNKFQGEAHKLSSRLENQALRRHPNGPLWGFMLTPHRCGVIGPHVMADCVPYPADAANV